MRDVDSVIALVKETCSAVEVRQLQVSHPGADDDGIWFFTQPNSLFEVQIESSDGMCPFLIETAENYSRFTAHSVDETAAILSTLLHLKNQ